MVLSLDVEEVVRIAEARRSRAAGKGWGELWFNNDARESTLSEALYLGERGGGGGGDGQPGQATQSHDPWS